MYTVYRLTPKEFDRYRQHLLNLDTEARYMRFGFSAPDDLINFVCDKIDTNPQQHKIFVIENQDLEVVAAGHIALTNGNVEFAFSVIKEYRKQGMGQTLLKKCIQWCQNRNIKQGMMVCLANNLPMRRLAHKEGLTISTLDGESEAVVTLPDATVYTIFKELVENNWSALDHRGKLNVNFAKNFLKTIYGQT